MNYSWKLINNIYFYKSANKQNKTSFLKYRFLSFYRKVTVTYSFSFRNNLITHKVKTLDIEHKKSKS